MQEHVRLNTEAIKTTEFDVQKKMLRLENFQLTGKQNLESMSNEELYQLCMDVVIKQHFKTYGAQHTWNAIKRAIDQDVVTESMWGTESFTTQINTRAYRGHGVNTQNRNDFIRRYC